jgi:hypothetical protein
MGAAEGYLPDFDREDHPFSPLNSRDTILHEVKDQAYCKSGIISPE